MVRLVVLAVLFATTAVHADPILTGKSTVVRKRTLDHGVAVEVRRSDSVSDGGVYQVRLRRHRRWEARFLALEDESCGAGHCLYEKVIGLRARRRGKGWRVTIRKESHRETNDCMQEPCGVTTTSDLVVDF